MAIVDWEHFQEHFEEALIMSRFDDIETQLYAQPGPDLTRNVRRRSSSKTPGDQHSPEKKQQEEEAQQEEEQQEEECEEQQGANEAAEEEQQAQQSAEEAQKQQEDEREEQQEAQEKDKDEQEKEETKVWQEMQDELKLGAKPSRSTFQNLAFVNYAKVHGMEEGRYAEDADGINRGCPRLGIPRRGPFLWRCASAIIANRSRETRKRCEEGGFHLPPPSTPDEVPNGMGLRSQL